MKPVQQSPHQEVDLISILGVYGSKRGLNLTSRWLGRHGLNYPPCTSKYLLDAYIIHT